MLQLPLNRKKSKKSTNINETLSIELSGSKRLLPLEPFSANVSESEQYYLERSECTKLRLVCHVNTICSNVLHNPITEIVRNEGTDAVEWLRDDDTYINGKNNVFLQGRSSIERKNALDDTQLSNAKNGFTYHCGLDILSNHIIRNQAFKTINKTSGNISDSFNTLSDYLRQYDGVQVQGYNAITSDNLVNLHSYLNEDVLTFKQSVEVNREVENGWVGFRNKGNFQAIGDNSLESNYHNVINNRKPCDFIDFYPERDLFYFTPKYNSKRRRIEKNWNYYITYPYSSTTDINFIRKKTNSLKVMFFDETSKGHDGLTTIDFTTVCKHGLQVGHLINVYVGDDVFSYNTRVTSVIDDYNFTCYKQNSMLSNKWLNIADFENLDTLEVDGYGTYVKGNGKYYVKDGKRYYITNNKMLNIDDDVQDVSFKRVINGEECEYYVRIFAKLPNWKLAPKKPNNYDLYKNENIGKFDLIGEYQKTEYDFQNSIGSLAFSRNIYNDDITEIVFTDDIDFDALKDNLGRPLSELFLTVVKNNRGYEEWYSAKDNDGLRDSDIEFSHCFGKNTCAFKLSDESLCHESYNSVVKINNIQNATAYNGLNVAKIQYKDQDQSKTEYNRANLDVDEIEPNPNRKSSNDSEKKKYCGDRYFYGDLCCYHKTLCNEMSIQTVDFRFNTVQRESSDAQLLKISAKEITYDDFDIRNFSVTSTNYGINVLQKPEGYYYKPHYRIPLRTFGDTVRTMRSQMLTPKKIDMSKEYKYTITILENNVVGLHTEILVYDRLIDEFYYGSVIKFHNPRKFECWIRKLNGDEAINITNDYSRFLFLIKPSDVPNYAVMRKDGSCIWYWRDIIQNGFDDNADSSEVYPFTNGALYAKLDVLLFVKRQDPNRIANAYSNSFLNDLEPSVIPQIQEDNYVNEEEIQC